MRCPATIAVGRHQVRCQGSAHLVGQPHKAHRWVALLKNGGMMEIHWREKPEEKR